MSPNSNGYDVRLFLHRVKMLRLRMRRHNLLSKRQIVDAAVNTPVVVDSNEDGTVAQELELEQMRIVETRSTTLENRPRLPRLALSKRNRAVVRALNPMLVTYLEASRDLCDTDSILFGAAPGSLPYYRCNFPRLDALLDKVVLSQPGE
ncbi:unnamed protein product [Parnassius apollo]|uniref:(apollo) hypothetical protein n=1 Tax=Parnassius apollo TaxID=110799 RepID=A0A8S3X9P4_PARAO|nr:unnamed protein product [Parnassius apollo]